MSWIYLNVLFTSSKCQDAISITQLLTQLIASKSIEVVAEKASSFLSWTKIKRHFEYFKNTELLLSDICSWAFTHKHRLITAINDVCF
jgi:hypothetical protein